MAMYEVDDCSDTLYKLGSSKVEAVPIHEKYKNSAYNYNVYHCKKKKVVLTQFVYLSFLSLVCIVKHSGVPLPALDSTQIKNLIWLSRTLGNVMGEYFAH